MSSKSAVEIYISVGSNVEPHRHVRSGVESMQRRFGGLRISRVYESESVGFEGENFLNFVVAATVTMSIPEVARELRQIEDAHRRDRNQPRFSPRTLDLDLLLYGDSVYSHDGLILPRDEITKNAFVLAPLAELAPDLVHPIVNKDYKTLWQEYDKSSQRLWTIDFAW